MCVRPYILCTITSRIMTIHISSWRATWRGNAAQCSSANIMGRKSGSIIVGNVAIWDGKPDNTVRHTHFTRAPVGHAHVAVPLLAWSCWRQRILTWDLSENPTSQSSRLTHEGSFHVSLRIMIVITRLEDPCRRHCHE